MKGGDSKRKDDLNENTVFLNNDLVINVRAQDHRYLQLLQRAPVAISTCDEAGYIRFYNEAATALWGRRPEIGKDRWCGALKIYKTNGNLLSDAETPAALTLQHQQSISSDEFIIERPDGTRRTIMLHTQLLYNATGSVEGVVNTEVDITSHEVGNKKNEQPTENERRYHSLIDEVEDYAIVLLSTEGIIQNWNRGAEKIKGYKPEEAIGKSFRMFYTPEDLTAKLPERLRDEAIRQGKTLHEGWRLRKDGSRFWGSVVLTALHDDVGEVIGLSKVTRDLTARKKAEDALIAKTEQLEEKNRALQRQHEALKKSEERYHHMISEVQDYAILLLSKEGIIENWNKGAEKIKGYTAEEAIGKHFSIFYGKEDRERKLPQQLIEEAKMKGKALHEGWRVRKDGTRFWGSIVITALHNEAGHVMGFSKVTRDLTERKLAEDALHGVAGQLKEKNKELEAMNQELASFAYVSSHDLQEPLRKIQTFSSRIVETELDNLTAKGKDFFLRMQNAALRMQTLIEDLLTYSRTNTAEKNFELSDLNALLEDVKHDLKEVIDEKGAIITSSPLPQAEVIRFQFRQLLTNILNNAIKFSKPDVPPRIDLHVDIVAGSAISSTHANPEKTYHHIAISDNGIGFEPEYRYKIFEVFQRLHGRMEYSGTGIGLAICKKIMDNHGGVITADSVPEEGATFHLYFPK